MMCRKTKNEEVLLYSTVCLCVIVLKRQHIFDRRFAATSLLPLFRCAKFLFRLFAAFSTHEKNLPGDISGFSPYWFIINSPGTCVTLENHVSLQVVTMRLPKPMMKTLANNFLQTLH